MGFDLIFSPNCKQTFMDMDSMEVSAKEYPKGFFSQVFKLDEDSQGEVLNMMQYVIIGFIPAILTIYIIRYYVPDPDDEKGSLTIITEIFAQTFAMFFAIYFIHRIIIYFPTYSGIKYDRFQIVNILLVFVMITFSIKTKLGEKAQILVERAVDTWSGEKNNAQSNTKVRVTQPITGASPSAMIMPMATAPPPPPALTNNRAQTGMGSMVKDFNAIYSQPSTQSQQPANQMSSFEPMAANEGGWGSSFNGY